MCVIIRNIKIKYIALLSVLLLDILNKPCLLLLFIHSIKRKKTIKNKVIKTSVFFAEKEGVLKKLLEKIPAT